MLLPVIDASDLRVSEALPPVPLQYGILEDLLDASAIEAVWVPVDRPESTTTLAGMHRGDIAIFWIETAEQYVHYEYTSRDGLGLAWY